MIKNTKNLSFTFSPRALLSVVPTVVNLTKVRKIQEFLFSLGSPDDFGSRSITTLEKQENYINFRVLLTIVKLFNSFLCKTSYSELLKDQL